MIRAPKNSSTNDINNGFTIIEVMIVLAIASLLMVVVLIAIPQLQRNQRNEARKNIAGRIVAEINAYAANNGGNIPLAEPKTGSPTNNPRQFGWPGIDIGFMPRYLGCSSSTLECEIDIIDPTSGFPVGSGADGMTRSVRFGGADNIEPSTTPGHLMYRVGTKCDGETAIASTGAGFSGLQNDFSFMIRLEGGAIYCLDNTN